MAQKKESEKIRIKKYIAILLRDRPKEVYNKGGIPSPSKIVKLVNEGLPNAHISRPTAIEYLKDNLSKYLVDTNFENSDAIAEYDEIMKSAKAMWDDNSSKTADRCKAQQTYLKAKSQKEKLLQSLEEQALKKADVKRPNYHLSFKPGSALRTCPRCGHQFYDVPKKNKDDKDEST